MTKKYRFSLVLILALSVVDTFGAEPGKTFSLYGFVLPTWIASSGGAESFSQPNLSAYTAAGNPAVGTVIHESRSSFQVAQSRFGFLVNPDANSQARLEFDFIDFTKSSPTTAALPRVRRALIDWKASPNLLVRFGQDWDLASPLAPHSYNYVGHYFESGDIGFMRIQAQALYTSGNHEHALALGLPGNNNLASDSTLELGKVPTLAIRETIKSDGLTFGGSMLVTAIRRDKVTETLLLAGAITAFAEFHPSSSLEIRTEAYVGQNTNNLGMLGLAFGNADAQAVKEAGGYVTARYSVDQELAFFGGIGGSWVLNPMSMLSSYSYPTPTTAALAGTGPGLERNLTARVGAEYKLTSSIVSFVELAGLATRHHLLPADVARLDPDRSIFLGQLGMQINI